MENKFIPLESEQDVLFFDGNTYIIWNFKKIISEEINNKFHASLNSNNRLKFLDSFKIISDGNNQIGFPTEKMTWHSSLKCKILRVGSPEWQSGELRIKAEIKFCIISSHIGKAHNILKIEIFLEFCDDKIIEYQSPLDDLRENIKT